MKNSGEKAMRLVYINFVWAGLLLLIIAGRASLKREEASAPGPRGVRKAGAAD